MKKYLCPFLLILIIAACKPKSASTNQSNQKDTVAAKKAKAKFQYTDSVFHQYATYLKTLDIKRAVSATSAATKYVELFKGRDQHACDTAFTIFNKFYATLTESLEEINEKDGIDLDKYFLMTNKPAIPPDVLAYVKDLKDNGFAITESEGSTYVSQDRDFVAKYFYSMVSPVMKEYLEQVNKENKQIYLEDGGLTITTDELVDRTVWWEKFEKAHPDFIWRHEVSTSKKEYQFVLLVGVDNTPVFMLGDSKPDERYLKSYAYLAQKYRDTETNKLVKPYYNLILKGDYNKAIKWVDNYQKSGVFKVDQ